MPVLSATLELFRLGPAAVFYDDVYVGEVAEDTDIEINYELTGVDLKSARLGRVNTAVTDYKAEVMVPVVEIDNERLKMAIPGSTLTGDLFEAFFTPGFLIRQSPAKALKIYRLVGTPLATSTDPDDIFILDDASVAPGAIKLAFNAKKQQMLPMKFTAWSNLTTGRVWRVGS